MSTLKVNKIQPNSSNHISIDGDTTITGSFIHRGVTTLSGTNVLSGSTVFRGTTTVEGDLTVGGRLTAQEVRTEFDNAAVVFESGSTKFGDSADDNHGFTGSLGVQGGEFKVTNSGDDVLIANPGTGTFTLGDTQGLGDAALITGDSTIIRVKNNTTTTLAVDNNNRVGIGTESPSGSFHVAVNSSDSYRDFVRFTNNGSTLFNINDEGRFIIGDVNGIGDGAYLESHGDEFDFRFGSTKALSITGGSTTINETLLIKNISGGDATLTLEADTTNTELSGENDNPAILFKQDGGSRNAAVGFNIIDDTSAGTVAGTGNRFWIVNAIGDNTGEGGITFGTAQVDGWENAIARFMIRGDGKGLFGHPNDHYDKVLGSQFEIYDDRTENTTSDYTLSTYGYVDVAEYPPSQGAGGIISRLKVVDGATDLGTHAIGMVAGTTTSEILTTGDFAFYAGSDMDTSGATGFAGVIHSGSSNWQIGGTGGGDADTGYKLNVVGTSKLNSDVLIEGVLNAQSAVIGGGHSINTHPSSSILGGHNNSLQHSFSTIAGGCTNYIGQRMSFIGAGSNNCITSCYNVVVGGAGNCIASTYSFIGSGTSNTIDSTGCYSFIGGGVNNRVGAPGSFILGGEVNCIPYNGCKNVIVAGVCNRVEGCHQFIGGGLKNTFIGTKGQYSSIVGGCCNKIYACIGNSTCNGQFIGGGVSNSTHGQYTSVVGGHSNNACCHYTAILGGSSNHATGQGSSVVGGFENCANGSCSFVGGGFCNQAKSTYSSVTSGYQNDILGSTHSNIGGGANNTISGSGLASSILGGDNNLITGKCNSILGGCDNRIKPGPSGALSSVNIILGGGNNNLCQTIASSIGGCNNRIHESCCSNIAGGALNYISGSSLSTINGGQSNTIQDCNLRSSIGGGYSNKIQHDAHYTSIVGGYGNCICNCMYSTIAGGRNNSIACSTAAYIGGGCSNTSIGFGHFGVIAGGCANQAYCYSFIGGGNSNRATSACSVIAGGCNNETSQPYSGILGGQQNRVDHVNSFIIGSSLTSTAQNYTFVNNLCNVGGGTSDCRLKENIENIPYGLTQVTQLDPVSFNFIDDESKKTKYGFLAQCVKEVMPELVYHHPTQTVDGEPVLQFDKDAVWASTVNAIKELKQEVEELKAEISILKQK